MLISVERCSDESFIDISVEPTKSMYSAAKFIATSVLETYLDSSVYINNGIFILETMGRDTGWLASAAALAKLNGKQVADFIYLPETAFDIDKFLVDVKNKFEEQNQVYIVASEGIRNAEIYHQIQLLNLESQVKYIEQDPLFYGIIRVTYDDFVLTPYQSIHPLEYRKSNILASGSNLNFVYSQFVSSYSNTHD